MWSTSEDKLTISGRLFLNIESRVKTNKTVYHIKDNKRLPIIISVTIRGAADLHLSFCAVIPPQQHTGFRFFPRLMIELLCYKLFTDMEANNNNNNRRNGNIRIRPVIFHHQTNDAPVEE